MKDKEQNSVVIDGQVLDIENLSPMGFVKAVQLLNEMSSYGEN